MKLRGNILDRTQQHGLGMDITIAPLIDVVLLLLIFFMLITRFMNPAITVDVPSSDTAAPLDSIGVIVSLSNDGKTYLNDQQVSLEQLETRLIEIKQSDGIEILRIRSDQDVEVQKLIDVLDIALRLHLDNVAIETKVVSEND